MSIGTSNFFNYFHLYLINDTVQCSSDTLYVSLHTSAFVPTGGEQKWADISGTEIAAGNGYSSGGLQMTTVAFALSAGNLPPAIMSADNSVWTSAGGGSIAAWRVWVIRSGATHNGVVQPLMMWGYGDNTPQDVPATPTGKTLNIDWNNGNIFTA